MRLKTNSLTNIALQKFKNNFWGVLSLIYIVLCGGVAIFAYLIAPDSSQNANQMHLSIHSKGPGFSVQVLEIPQAEHVNESGIKTWVFGKKNQTTELPITSYRKVNNNTLEVYPYTENKQSKLKKEFYLHQFADVSSIEDLIGTHIKEKKFLLGTDKYGRDLLSRVLVGARISFFIGFIAVFISLVIGVFMGAISGYYGGRIDAIIMWLINITWSIPTLLLVIAITLALGKGYWQVFIAVGLTMWVEVARVVRGQVKGVKEEQYVTAARALGYSDARIVFRHILPNALTPLIVISAANFAASILIESGLSFLGIGAQPPVPSWGAMIKDHYSYIILGKPYLALVPGFAIMSLVMAFMLVGNALRDALDVKQQ